MSRIASRYAIALLELAVEEDKLDFYCEEMQTVSKTLKQNQEILPFLMHYQISKQDKKAVIAKIFATDNNKTILRFLFLIIDQGRSNIINQIIEEFIRKANQERGVIFGEVYSTKPLSKQQIKDVEEAIGLKLKYKIQLENMIDPELMSGIKVVVRDQVFDGSLKNRISMLKKSLLSRGG